MQNPKVFISYSWDSKSHEDWVLFLADKLLQNGITVILDKYELRLGNDLHYFMENSVSISDKTLLILTPNYKLKAESRIGGVGHEYSIINSKYSEHRTNNRKFIPILKEGTSDESVPINLKSSIFLDMRSPQEFDKKFDELLRDIYDKIDKRPMPSAVPKDHQRNIGQIEIQRNPISNEILNLLRLADNDYENKNYSSAVIVYINYSEYLNSDQQFRFGNSFHRGLGLQVNYSEALKWYQKAADNGNPNAIYGIGKIYQEGLGVDVDLDLAMKWYRKAADEGNPDAHNQIGFLLYNKKNYLEALKWFHKADELGSLIASRNIGVLFENGYGVQQDYYEALKWYQKSMKNGYINSATKIGSLYYYGKGVKQDYAEAMKWYKDAADKENTEAMLKLGDMYRNGLGIDKDSVKAIEWYKKAATKGNAEAMFNLGDMSVYHKAKEWFQKAAEQGHAEAINRIRNWH